MSFYATGWVWKNICQDPDRTSIQKLIMLCLANYANEDDNYSCNVRLSTLTKVTSLHKETVSRNIQALSKDGFLNITKNYRDDGGQKANTYQIPCGTKSGGGDTSRIKGGSTEDEPLYIDINKDISYIKETALVETNTPIVPKYNPAFNSFEELWKAYPASRRGDKKRSRKKYAELNKNLSCKQIYEAVTNFLEAHMLEKGGDLEYLKHLSTLLNTDLIPLLTPLQHEKGEFDIKNFDKYQGVPGLEPPKYTGRFLNPDYQIWLSEQQFKEDKDENRSTSTDQKYVN